MPGWKGSTTRTNLAAFQACQWGHPCRQYLRSNLEQGKLRWRMKERVTLEMNKLIQMKDTIPVFDGRSFLVLKVTNQGKGLALMTQLKVIHCELSDRNLPEKIMIGYQSYNMDVPRVVSPGDL